MSDASTKQSVECPICGDEFDPTVAGGWCTNTECGEWQYTEGSTESDGTMADSDETGGTASDDDDPIEEDDTEAESVALFEDAEESEDADTDDSAADPAGTVDDAGAEEADEADEPAVETDEVGADDTDEGGVADTDEGATDAADEIALGDSDEDAADADETAADDTDEADVEDIADEADADEADADEADDTIDCPDCGVELEAEANFCVECGADVSDVTPGEPETEELEACPGCGTDVEPEDNFCVECGEDLDAHRAGDVADHDDAIDALEATADDGDEAGVPDSLVLEVEGREIQVDDGDTVGREIRAALTDAGRPDDEAVRIHREHVRFVREADSFYLLDLGDNPTQINGQALQKGDREPVTPGDEIELSGVASVSVQAP